MRANSFLVLFCCLAVTSCNRHKLPPIKDAAVLHKDSAILYEQFPASELPTNAPNYDYQHSLGFRIIPKDKWLPSILDLHPYMVCSYQGGIQMWIVWPRYKDEGKYWNGYYVVVNPAQPPPPQAATNHFVFNRTDTDGVLLLKQTKFQN
jgi:hypothetical protein